jgi:sec-independent protein translocase protein TatC
MMMGVPLMVLYEISVVAVWLFARKGFVGFDKKLPESENISE